MSKFKRFSFFAFTFMAILGVANLVSASHSWGGYHWARTTQSFTLKLGDNVNGPWDSILNTTSQDWSSSIVLDTVVVLGQTNPKVCKATSGRVEVCNSKYGQNGWLGIASVWTNGSHIVQATVKLNDTYFTMPKYNSTAWRNLVSCQEVGHTFGLDHQDEVFDNANLDTCMDYTNDPTTNQHPNAHDYAELETIYGHTDTTTTVSQSGSSLGQSLGEERSQWGTAVRKDASGKDSVFEKDLGDGNKVVTHVFWAE